MVANDFASLFDAYPAIERVLLNSASAETENASTPAGPTLEGRSWSTTKPKSKSSTLHHPPARKKTGTR
jgi:hypothetical protein